MIGEVDERSVQIERQLSRPNSASEEEERRIKEAYAGRGAKVKRGIYSFFSPGSLFIYQERERRMLDLLSASGCTSLEQKRILEVGCGSGVWIREFIKWGAQPENLVGIDLLPERIALARARCPTSVALEIGNAVRLRFASASFDLILQATAFSSILDPEVRARVAQEMLRTLKPGGSILWYDFFVKSRRNLDVVGIGKKEILRLFPKCQVILRRVTLAPPIARLLAPLSWLLCCFLAEMRLLDTHYIALIRPQG